MKEVLVTVIPKVIDLGTTIATKIGTGKANSKELEKANKVAYGRICYARALSLSNRGKLTYEECQKLMMQMGGKDYG